MLKIGISIRKTELETKTDSATESFLNRPQDVINYIYLSVADKQCTNPSREHKDRK